MCECEGSGLRWWLGGVVETAASRGLLFDGDGEGGEVFVPDDPSEGSFGFEHAGCGPPKAHVPGLPALDVSGCLSGG